MTVHDIFKTKIKVIGYTFIIYNAIFNLDDLNKKSYVDKKS